ncbi:MAG: response regulator [Bacteroidetes bacterium]|nr:response regulator [Bacteroidota bacterium]
MEKREKIRIFFVDDDPIYLKMLENNLRSSKVYSSKVFTFKSGEEAIKNLHLKPDVIVLDYYLNGTDPNALDGIKSLEEIKHANPNIEVVMLSGQDRIEVAVNSIKSGAFDYVTKSESAFVRTQNAINNIVNAKKLKDEAKGQRIWIRVAASVFMLAILVFLTLSFLYPMK